MFVKKSIFSCFLTQDRALVVKTLDGDDDGSAVAPLTYVDHTLLILLQRYTKLKDIAQIFLISDLSQSRSLHLLSKKHLEQAFWYSHNRGNETFIVNGKSYHSL